MSSPQIVLTASSSEASEWRHSIWQQMLSATIPAKYAHKFINPEALVTESWPDGRAKYVPNGLRMVETLLLREYSEEDVVVTCVEHLEKFDESRMVCRTGDSTTRALNNNCSSALPPHRFATVFAGAVSPTPDV